MRNTYEDRCPIQFRMRLTLRCLRFLYIYARYRLKMHNYAEHASREYLFFVHKILLMKIRSFFWRLCQAVECQCDVEFCDLPAPFLCCRKAFSVVSYGLFRTVGKPLWWHGRAPVRLRNGLFCNSAGARVMFSIVIFFPKNRFFPYIDTCFRVSVILFCDFQLSCFFTSLIAWIFISGQNVCHPRFCFLRTISTIVSTPWGVAGRLIKAEPLPALRIFSLLPSSYILADFMSFVSSGMVSVRSSRWSMCR